MRVDRALPLSFRTILRRRKCTATGAEGLPRERNHVVAHLIRFPHFVAGKPFGGHVVVSCLPKGEREKQGEQPPGSAKDVNQAEFLLSDDGARLTWPASMFHDGVRVLY